MLRLFILITIVFASSYANGTTQGEANLKCEDQIERVERKIDRLYEYQRAQMEGVERKIDRLRDSLSYMHWNRNRYRR